MDGDCVASPVKLLNLGILYLFSTGKNILTRNLCHFIKGMKKLEPILSFIGAGKLFYGFFYRFIGAEKLFFGFFYRFIGEKKFCPTKLYRFIRFFSQKLCIGIALIDTFLSISAHLWYYASRPLIYASQILNLRDYPVLEYLSNLWGLGNE
jgi:hypothetical protein